MFRHLTKLYLWLLFRHYLAKVLLWLSFIYYLPNIRFGYFSGIAWQRLAVILTLPRKRMILVTVQTLPCKDLTMRFVQILATWQSPETGNCSDYLVGKDLMLVNIKALSRQRSDTGYSSDTAWGMVSSWYYLCRLWYCHDTTCTDSEFVLTLPVQTDIVLTLPVQTLISSWHYLCRLWYRLDTICTGSDTGIVQTLPWHRSDTGSSSWSRSPAQAPKWCPRGSHPGAQMSCYTSRQHPRERNQHRHVLIKWHDPMLCGFEWSDS